MTNLINLLVRILVGGTGALSAVGVMEFPPTPPAAEWHIIAINAATSALMGGVIALNAYDALMGAGAWGRDQSRERRKRDAAEAFAAEAEAAGIVDECHVGFMARYGNAANFDATYSDFLVALLARAKKGDEKVKDVLKAAGYSRMRKLVLAYRPDAAHAVEMLFAKERGDE